MPDELKSVASFTHVVEAELAKIRLESAGIRAVLANEIIARSAGPLLSIYPVLVQVREEDEGKALEILSEKT